MSRSALTLRWLRLQEWGLERVGRMVPARRHGPAHLETGLRGERAALFHLRRLGYIVVAQRWTNAKVRGDLDLIAWDEREQDGQPWLCFVEVKTRTVRDLSPAESAVDEDKQRTLRSLARAYLRAFPEEKRRRIPVRFDVVSVYLLEKGAEFDVFEGAFSWR